jgi:hypothetical protein
MSRSSNTKSEILNAKQILTTKIQMFQTEVLNLCILKLFRISCLEFRVLKLGFNRTK